VLEAPLVEARGLTKIYPPRGGSDAFRAVDGIDFELARGEAFGFLGPNGAGKSSTMRMISAISPVSGGTLRVLGLDPACDGPRIRARIGVVPQDDCLDRELTVQENLFIYGRYFGLSRAVIRERAAGLLEFAQLGDKAGEQVEALSGGMRRRLTIARSLINEPEILLLDEPTTGLDPQARHVLWDRLFRLKQDGVTLILTTHYMDEAEQLCDRLVVLDRGRIVAQGSPRDLIDAHGTREVLELRFPVGLQEPAAQAIRAGSGAGGVATATWVDALPDRVLVYADDGEAALAAVHGLALSPLTALVRRATLEDVFLKLTGRSLID
jgi:lipooligosaccharide transport system ATP-binding protein